MVGAAGCVSAPGQNAGCMHARALRGAVDLAISRDGKSVYVAGGLGGNGTIAVFRRDPSSGRLTQLRGTAGCLSSNGSGGACSTARALHGTAGLAISADGRNVYAISTYGDGDGISVFRRDTNTGALTQLAGTAGCVSANGTGGACAAASEFFPRGSIALSADGRNLYAVSFRGVDVFSRDPATGALAQLPKPHGCVTESGSRGSCVDGRGLLDASVLGVSPDGRSVYVAGGVGDSHTPTGDIAVFERDPATGALGQRPGKNGCLSETDSSCAAASTNVEDPSSIALSADGKSLYLGAFHLLLFTRAAPTGALEQQGGANLTVSGLALSPDSRNLYASAVDANALDVFSRTPSSGPGAVRQLAAPYGCIATGGRRCMHARPLEQPGAVAVSPDGRNVYLVSGLRNAVLVFTRRR
jgi:DNA-binding beta-propeller fold protein YncE